MRRKPRRGGDDSRVRGVICCAHRFLACAMISGMLAAGSARAQDTYQPTAQNLKARPEFQDAKFGLFIH